MTQKILTPPDDLRLIYGHQELLPRAAYWLEVTSALLPARTLHLKGHLQGGRKVLAPTKTLYRGLEREYN